MFFWASSGKRSADSEHSGLAGRLPTPRNVWLCLIFVKKYLPLISFNKKLSLGTIKKTIIMKKYIAKMLLGLFVALSGCRPDKVANAVGPEAVPVYADLIEIDGLQKAVIRNGAGKATEEGSGLNGLKEGAWITYNEEGVPTSLVTYHQGKQQGLALTFDKNASLSSVGYYSGGKKEGEFRSYKNKILSEIKTYENGLLNGLCVTFYPNKKAQQEIYHTDGKYNGMAKWFDQKGNLIIAYIYKDGKLIDKNPALSPEDSVSAY